MKNVVFLTLLIFTTQIVCAQQNKVSKTSHIDNYINKVIDRYGFPGFALAIIKDGNLIHKNYYGKANIEHDVNVHDKSIFRLYSLTKIVIVTGVYQLIEQKKLSLEDPISKYLDDLPNTWHSIQIKHLITHSSGLPDIVSFPEIQDLIEEEVMSKVLSEPIRFEPGEQFDYNQTNFWLLQRIIELVTAEKLEDFIRKNQFDVEKGSKSIFFSSDSRDIIPNRATPYFSFTTGKQMIDHSYQQGRYLYATNGLNSTLDEFINWNKKLDNNELINENSKNKMWESFPYKEISNNFTYGWDQHILNNEASVGFSGSLVTVFRKFPKSNLSIILFGNGIDKYINIDEIVNHIAGLVDENLLDKYAFKREVLLTNILDGGFLPFYQSYKNLKNKSENNIIDFESIINDIGYTLMKSFENNNLALQCFELNTHEFPNSWNVYDSFGEALEQKGQLDKALENYKKALELNVTNEHKLNPILRERIGRLSKVNNPK